MRYVQLRAFHFVAHHGGFSAAAEALHLTQPAISDQVRKLEEEYDVLLFSRLKKRVALTKAGERLLVITNQLFEIEGQARELLQETQTLRAGTLRIVADSALHLLHILHPFRVKYPDIAVRVRTGNSVDVTNALLNYEADIGVLGEVPVHARFDVLQLAATPLVAFAAVGSPAAKAKQLSLEELVKYPLVLREPGSKTRHILEQCADRAGVELNAAIEATGREAVREIVASGAGVGIVAEAEFGFDPRLKKIKLSGPPIFMDEALICLRERLGSKLIGAFMDIARANT